MPDALTALRHSVDRLTAAVRPLDDTAVVRRAYPSEWTIADVVSHLGSAAIIGQRRLADSLSGDDTPGDFNSTIWDEWNAKSPRAKVDDGLAAIEAFLGLLEDMPVDRRRKVRYQMGPMELDWEGYLKARLNEQLVHEWDITVTLDPTAALGADGVEIMVDNLELIARFTARSSGDPGAITVGTSAPERSFTVTVDRDNATLTETAPPGEPTLWMRAEAFIRLVYGRLDPDHTPDSVSGDPGALDQLRAIFPGP